MCVSRLSEFVPSRETRSPKRSLTILLESKPNLGAGATAPLNWSCTEKRLVPRLLHQQPWVTWWAVMDWVRAWMDGGCLIILSIRPACHLTQ